MNIRIVPTGLDPALPPFKGKQRTRISRMAGLSSLKAYRATLLTEGRGVPENPQKPGEIWWSQVRRETGMTPDATRHGGYARKAILDLATEVGLAPSSGSALITLARFKQNILRDRKAELDARSDLDQRSKDKALANLRWALNKLQVTSNSHACARTVVEAVLRDLEPKQTSLKAELNNCLNHLAKYEIDADLPPEFAAAMTTAMLRRGMTNKQVAAQVGMLPDTLNRWARGPQMPTRRMMHHVAAIERVLRLSEGTLASRVRFRHQGVGPIPRELVFPPGFERDTKLRRRAARLLPHDIGALPPHERDRVFAAACKTALDEQARLKPMRDHFWDAPYRLNDWPARLESEWADLHQFKSEVVLARDEDVRDGTILRDGSLSIFKYYFGTIFGYLTSEQGQPPISPGNLTFAVMLFADRFYNSFLEFRKLRNMGASNALRGYNTYSDIQLLLMVRTLVKPKVGWLAQRPEYGERLVPIEGLISAEDIQRVGEDWVGACKRAHDDCWHRFKSYKGYVKKGRDSHERVLPILDSARPLSALRILNENLQRECDESRPGTLDRAQLLRVRVLSGILAQVPLRPETLRMLDYRADNTGHLRFENGRWRLRISRLLFKNFKSTYFQVGAGGWRDFDRTLFDASGLYGAIEEYVASGRDLILDDPPAGPLATRTDALFVIRPTWEAENVPVRLDRGALRLPDGTRARTKDPARMPRSQITERFKHATARYIAWNPVTGEGIKGVKPFTPLHCRHIVATGVLKRTGSWTAAADAIQDNPLMVQMTYGRYLPPDREHLLDGALSEAYIDDEGFEDVPGSPRLR